MAGPGDEIAAPTAGGGQFRASQADREQAIEVLKTAFVEDRVTKDEFDVRVDQALGSRTYAELAAVTADIPAGLVADQTPRGPARAQARPPMSNPAKVGICVAIAIAVPAVLTLAIGGIAPLMFAPFYLMALLVAGAQMLLSRHEKRSRGQLPPQPGQGGQAPEGQQPCQVSHDPALPEGHPDRARTELRTHRSRPGRSHCSWRDSQAPRGIGPVPDAV